MKGSLFLIITPIGLTPSREEKAFQITTWTYITCAIRTLDERPNIFIRDKSIFLSERTLRKDYNRKYSVAGKKISGRDPQGAWRQDELIGSKLSALE
jgi:hypothetical protein